MTKHVIDDISYPEDGPSWLVCATDGKRLSAETPDELGQLWQRHGGKLLVELGQQPKAATTGYQPRLTERCPETGCDNLHPRYATRGGCKLHPWHAPELEPKPKPKRIRIRRAKPEPEPKAARIRPMAECHPDRPHRARGLCEQCYRHKARCTADGCDKSANQRGRRCWAHRLAKAAA